MVAVVGVIAQPQGGRRYLPPGQEQGNGRSPSSQYGAPSNGASRLGGQSSGRPSSQYGAPANGGSRVGGQATGSRSGASSTKSGSPSTQYGAPSGSNGGQFNGYADSRGNGNSQQDDLAVRDTNIK